MTRDNQSIMNPINEIEEKKSLNLAEAENIKTKEYFELMFNTGPDAVLISRVSDGLIVDANEGFLAMTGYSRAEVIGKSVLELNIYKNPADRQKIVKELSEKGYCKNEEMIFQRKDGSELTGSVSAKMTMLNGTPHIFSSTRDITGTRRAEQALRESEELFKSVIYNSLDLIVLTDEKGIVTHVSHQCLSILGYPQEKFIGQTMPDIIHPDDKTKCQIAWEQAALHEHELREFEYRIIDGGGGVRWLSHSAKTVKVDDRVLGLQNTIRDITERKLAEEVLCETNAYLENLINYANAPIIVWDTKFCITRFNHAFEFLSGRSEAEVIGQSIEILFPPALIGHSMVMIHKTLIGERLETVEIEILHRDGSTRTVLWNSATLFTADGRTPIATIAQGQDITERKQADKALHIALAKYKTLFGHFPLGITVSDEAGNILESNSTAEKLLGVRQEEHIQRDIDSPEWHIVRPDGTPMPPDEFASVKALKEKRVVENVEMGIIKPDDNLIWLNVTAAPLPIEGHGVVITYADITERKVVEEALRKSEFRFSQLFHNMISVFSLYEVVLDENGRPIDYRYLEINTTFETFTGKAASELIGRTLLEVFPLTEHYWIEKLEEVFMTGISNRFESYSKELDTNIEISIFSPQKGQLAMISNDITDRKVAEESLRQSEEKFRKAFIISPDSININRLSDGMYVSINDGFTRIMGYTEAECVGKSSAELNIWANPEDRKKLISGLMENGEVENLEAPFYAKNGDIKYGLMSASVLDLNGVKHIISITRNITERKKAEDALRESNAYLENLINYANAPIIVWDPQFRITRFNHAFETLTGRLEADVLGQSLEILFPPAFAAHSMTLIRQTLSGKRWETVEIKILHRDGSVRTVLWNSATLFTADGQTPIATIAQGQDITERKLAEDSLQKVNEQLRLHVEAIEQLQAELREQAIRDPLTGLYNRRYLDETSTREIARAERENGALSVIMSDIDHFKIANDTYGHPVGDKFLVEIANLIKNHARGSDIVCRYGGEEFLLVLPGTSLDSAAKRAEEICQKCAELVIQHEGKDLKVTMSFGVATYPDHGQEAEEIIIKADNAMYQSKHRGRNQVTVWRENY